MHVALKMNKEINNKLILSESILNFNEWKDFGYTDFIDQKFCCIIWRPA